MPKRTMFTNITPLPPSVSREVAIAMLHNHDEMIELNPLVIEHHPIKTPRDAPADEFLDCVWQELTDRVSYLPGGLVKGKVTYRACFHDTPTGLQTHIYAPMGLEIRERWSVGGTLPGEPPEARELGVDTPRTGLYLREDGDMKCNIMMTNFVRKNLDNSHKVLVERILKKAERVEQHLATASPTPSGSNISTTGGSGFQRGSHMSQSQFVNSPRMDAYPSPAASPARPEFSDMSLHPAFRYDPRADVNQRESMYTPPSYHSLHGPQNGYPQDPKQSPYPQDVKQNPYHQHMQSSSSQQHPVFAQELPSDSVRKEFVAELPGSTPESSTSSIRPKSHSQNRPVSELAAGDSLTSRLPDHQGLFAGSINESMVSEPSQRAHQRQQYTPYRDPHRISNSQSEQTAELPTADPSKPSFQQYQNQRAGQS